MADPFALIESPVRREILRLVWKDERGAGEIAQQFPSLTFGAVSQHLAKLLAAGVVRRRREGKRLFYRARPEALGPIAAMLEAFWVSALSELKAQAEAEQRKKPRARTPESKSMRSARPATRKRTAGSVGRKKKSAG